MAVECDGTTGVEFSLAEGNFSIQSLEEVDFAQSHLPDQMLQPSYLANIMTSQLTELSDKSFILSISVSHSVFDGSGFFNFISQWAQLTKGEILTGNTINRVSLLSRFNPAPGEQQLITPDEYEVVSSDKKAADPNFQLPKMASANLILSLEKLRKYRDELPAKNLSANDILCAALWRSVIRARQLPNDKLVKFGMAVDGRSRMNPPLSSDYFGNVNYWVTVKDKVNNLLTSSLDEVAGLIRAKVQQVTEEQIDLVNHWIAQQSNKAAIQPGFSHFLGDDFAMTSWAQFPIYKTDFGLGQPVKFRIPTREFDGFALVFPVNNCPNLEITIGLKQESLQALLEDPELKRFLA